MTAGVERVVRGHVVEALSKAERKQLEADEAIIAQGVASFVAVGEALADIRDHRLYRETHETFISYCKERWDLASSRAYQQIWAIEAIKVVREHGEVDEVPKNERVARELGTLLRGPGGDPDKMLEAWQLALQEADGEPPTTEVVRNAVRHVRYIHSPYYAELGEGGNGQRLSMPGDMFRDVAGLAKITKKKLARTPLPDKRGLAHLELGWRNKVQADIEECITTLVNWRKALVDASDTVDEAAAPRVRRSR